jgi:hypothetical protein
MNNFSQSAGSNHNQQQASQNHQADGHNDQNDAVSNEDKISLEFQNQNIGGNQRSLNQSQIYVSSPFNKGGNNEDVAWQESLSESKMKKPREGQSSTVDSGFLSSDIQSFLRQISIQANPNVIGQKHNLPPQSGEGAARIERDR